MARRAGAARCVRIAEDLTAAGVSSVAVILDTVDGEPFPPGVLLAGTGEGSTAAKLLNASVPRARGRLVLLGDVAHYRARSPSERPHRERR